MQRKTGVHFYINIANFDDVAEKEEAATQFPHYIMTAFVVSFTKEYVMRWN